MGHLTHTCARVLYVVRDCQGIRWWATSAASAHGEEGGREMGCAEGGWRDAGRATRVRVGAAGGGVVALNVWSKWSACVSLSACACRYV
eukprot:803653-Pleurochrysis_carterae.AAC.1